MNRIYLETARLLTQIAPLVFADETFALKGGTAINLFARDMPRLSVPPRRRCRRKLLVRRGDIEVKIEVNFVLRGTVRPVQRASLTPKARETLLADLEIPVVSLEDMYGGKLVAALDRQHPRDLFDVMQLFSHEGITPGIRRTFVVYLASHNRPIHEVLFPSLRDVQGDYAHGFQGMTVEPVPLDALLAARERMVRELQQGLDENERQFLLSLAAGNPEWTRLDIAHLDQLPGIRWKMHNLEQLLEANPRKFAEQADALAARLDSGSESDQLAESEAGRVSRFRRLSKTGGPPFLHRGDREYWKGFSENIVSKDGALWIEFIGEKEPPAKLLALTDATYFLEGDPSRMTFIRDRSGKVTGYQLIALDGGILFARKLP